MLGRHATNVDIYRDMIGNIIKLAYVKAVVPATSEVIWYHIVRQSALHIPNSVVSRLMFFCGTVLKQSKHAKFIYAKDVG